jgi:Tfp pilus assembly protein PilN
MRKKENKKSEIRWVLFIKTLILNPTALRIGMTNDTCNTEFVIISSDDEGGGVPVLWRTDIPVWLRLLLPIITVTDTGDLPVYMVSDDIGDDDPDEWIDNNEERCLPAGFPTDAVSTDYAVNNGRVVAISAVTGKRDEMVANLEDIVRLSSLLAPLQGVAQLCGKEQCIVWKLTTNGSSLSRIEQGVVTDACTCCWISLDDVKNGSSETLERIGRIVHSIAGDWDTFPVIFLAPENVATFSEGTRIGGGKIAFLQKYGNLPMQFIEAFGNAITPDRYVQLLPFHKKQSVKKLLRGWCRLISSMRAGFILLLIVAAVFGSYIGTTRLILNRDNASMEKIKKQHDEVRHAAASRDALMKKLEKQTAFVRGESRITTMLNELQTAVPEGAALEELSVGELSDDNWEVLLHVRTESSSVMQPFLKGIEKVNGISDVRMVYSERGEDRSGKSTLLFKVKGRWK